MEKIFYVIDGANWLSCNEKTGAPEHFLTESAATNRARILAEADPGARIKIAASIGYVTAPVGKIEVHPV